MRSARSKPRCGVAAGEANSPTGGDAPTPVRAECSRATSRSPPRIEWARPGDYSAIVALLASSLPGFEAAEFEASLDDPFYAPTDRILIRERGRIVAHAHLVKRTMRYGVSRIPIGRIRQVVVAAEFAGRGYGVALLEAAGAQLSEDGAALALIRSTKPERLAAAGWGACGTNPATQVAVRDLLPHLAGRSPLAARQRPIVRQWRQFEIDALSDVYRAACYGRIGPLERGEAYAQWLTARGLHDDIHLALAADAARDSEFGARPADVEGYAIVRGPHVLELIARDGKPAAALALLARVAADALEQDREQITLHAPPDDPLHELAVAAGGIYLGDPPRGAKRGGLPLRTTMAKVLSVPRCIAAIAPELRRRWHTWPARQTGELTLSADGCGWRLVVSRRDVRVEVADAAAHQCRLLLTAGELAAVVLGHSSLAHDGDLFGHLFPRTRAWFPPFDDPS